MSSCLHPSVPAIRCGGVPAEGTPAGTLVVGSADLRVNGGTVTVAGRAPSKGQATAFCRLVLTAPAVVRRDGTVLADAWLPDVARLGELEAHLGDGVIEDLVAEAVREGRLPRRERRRIMSYPLVIRLTIAMALAPDGSYCEALSRLAGLLAGIPFARQWHIPAEKVITDWRRLVPPALAEALFWKAAGPLVSDGDASAVTLAGRPVAAAGGMLVNVADTKRNREFSGTTGTADGSSPFPQLLVVALIARAGRAMPGAILGQATAGEQSQLKRLVRRRPDLFRGIVVCFGRNFPGHDLIPAIPGAGGHVVARARAGIALPFQPGPDMGWLGNGSRMTWLNAPSGRKAERLPVRACEHNAVFPAVPGGEQEVSETCTIITTLLDHEAAPAAALRDTYLTRWGAAETTFGQDKATITGAGNRTPGPVLRSGEPRLVIQEAWAWLTGTQLVRASSAAALAGEHAAARAPRRRSGKEVTADEESFTAGRHHAIRSMTTTQVTATSSLAAIAAASDSAARAVLHTLNLPGRHRRSERKQKARPKFPHTASAKATATARPRITVFAPGFY